MAKLTKFDKLVTVPILTFISTLIFIFAWTVVSMTNSTKMSESLKFAADKGIDPMAVRCVYSSEWKIDNLCVIYITHYKQRDHDVSVPVIPFKK